MKTPTFSVSLLHPRFWLTWFFMGLWVLVAQLPFRLQMQMGQALGGLLYRLATRRRKIAERNLALCFPEKTEAERAQLVRLHFVTIGLAIFETGIAWFSRYSKIKHRYVIKGQEHWQKLIDEGQGALVIGLHFNTLEIANFPITRLFKMSVSYRPHDNAVYDWVQFKRRSSQVINAHTFDRSDLRGMVRALKSGGFLWYAPDQDYGRKVSEFVPLFGVEAATIKTTPKLLRMAGVPAIGLIYRRLPDFSGYEIEFKAPIADLPSGDDKADLVTLNRYIEECIKTNISEYLWVHRRFKTRPEGEASVYQ